jgi:hypothetical protein
MSEDREEIVATLAALMLEYMKALRADAMVGGKTSERYIKAGAIRIVLDDDGSRAVEFHQGKFLALFRQEIEETVLNGGYKCGQRQVYDA